MENKKILANINKLFSERNSAIKFVADNDSMILVAKRKTAVEAPKPEPSKTKTKNKIFIRIA